MPFRDNLEAAQQRIAVLETELRDQEEKAEGGWGWWYRELDHPGFGLPLYFFWCAPFAMLALVLVEGFLIRAGLRPARDRE